MPYHADMAMKHKNERGENMKRNNVEKDLDLRALSEIEEAIDDYRENYLQNPNDKLHLILWDAVDRMFEMSFKLEAMEAS